MAIIEGPDSSHLPKALTRALQKRFGEAGLRAIASLEKQANSQYRPALDLLRERMAMTDALQQAATEDLLDQPDGLSTLLDSYADQGAPRSAAAAQPASSDPYAPLEDPTTRQAKAIRAMDDIVRTLATTIVPYEAPRLSANKNINMNADLQGLTDEELQGEYERAVNRAALRMIDPALFPAEEPLPQLQSTPDQPQPAEQNEGNEGKASRNETARKGETE